MKFMIDSHAHMDDEKFNYDRDEILKSLKENNIAYFINPSSDIESSRKAVELSRDYDFIYSAVGIHPHEAEKFKEEYLIEIEEMTNNKKVVAIGEIGLDYYYDNSPREIQKEVFIKQMDLAKKLNLPVIIHSRDAQGDTFDILRKYKDQVIGVMHCYSGSLEMAKRYMDLGYYISFAGPVTFKNARTVKETAKEIPMDKILIETDSPYLSPEPRRGKRNDPRNLIFIANTITDLKEVPLSELVENTRNNTIKLFKLKDANFED